MIENLSPGGGGGGTVDTITAGTGISVDATNPANPIITNTSLNTDETAKVSSNDTTAGYLNGKLVAGTNITLTENNNGGNETLTIAASGLTGFTASQNTASPNNTVNASRLLVDATSTNADAVLQPKGTGAILAQLPDDTTTGGNKRGTWAIDLQLSRSTSNSVASGDRSVAIGSASLASGSFAVALGTQAQASGQKSFAVSELAKATNNGAVAFYYGTASGSGSFAWQGTASGSTSMAMGGTASGANSRSLSVNGTASGAASCVFGIGQPLADKYGQHAISSGSFAAAADCQYERYILRRETTDATPTILSCDGAAPASSTRIGIASDATYTFRAMVTARRTDADNESAGWEVKGVIDNNAGTTALVGSVTVTAIGDDSAGTWTVAVTADNTNDALQFEVTGEAGKTIRWGAVVELMKVAG